MKHIYIFFLLLSINTYAQIAMELPKLEFVCELKIKLKSPVVVGETPHGLCRIIAIVGGQI